MTVIVDHGQAYRMIEDFLFDYAQCLDQNRIEDWPDFFVEDCCYRVLSRENVELGLPAPIIYHYSRDMLRDRVTAIKDALTFEFVYTRHLISNVRLHGAKDDAYAVHANYMVMQSTEEGVSRVYSVGRTEDEIVSTADGLRFRRRDVIADTFGIENLMALPI